MQRIRALSSIKTFIRTFGGLLSLFPLTLHASFIESTMGAAVVNDATAAYFNPAALTLLKNPQIITLGTLTYSRPHFTGQAIQAGTGFTLNGNSNPQTNYYLPSLYIGIPTTSHLTAGVAVISNFFNKESEESSILRYAQANNSVKNIDFVSAIGLKLNNIISFGAGINFSYAHFLMQPLSGFPSLNIPDSQSRNECSGTSIGADAGLLLKPSPSTLIGFNYRSAMTYQLSGKSTFEGTPELVSNQYAYTFWTPARSVFSINQQISPKFGLIGTIQHIQWSILKNINIQGIATQIGPQTVILNATVPFHLRNTWVFTLGTHYRMTPKWIIRLASTYNQTPGNPHYQISNGDSIILGGSMGYEIFKNIILDGSYAHAFFRKEDITITRARNRINGTNQGKLDTVSLKLTF